MKKLALALVCLVGVAFLSSCDPTNVVENPEPSIAFMTGDDYIQDGDVLDYYGVYKFGVRAASNPETLEDLARLVITYKSDDFEAVLYDTVISGKEFSFEDYIYFADDDEKTLIGSFELIAEVTDAAKEKKAISMTCDVDWDDTLEVTEFTWNRHGSANGTGLEAFGLQWTSNGKEDFANITPLQGATLVKLDPSVWDEVNTETEKANLFSEQVLGINVFNEVSAWASHDYNFVLGTIDNEETHLIHIEKGVVTTFKGTDITITGHAK